jgi:predicted nucleotidyltransferase component of viral defense system
MIIQELKNIVQSENKKDTWEPYIRSLLKEYLQVYVLYFIYTAKKYQKNLIFTGGTCLRHFYDLDRLSEDIDFDFLKKVDTQQFANDLTDFFHKGYQYRELTVSVKQHGKQVLLKFPVLRQLGLATKSQSEWLYIKIDLSANNSRHFSTQTSSKSYFGFNFAAIHYDLPSLMTGKIHAILSRNRLQGRDDRTTIKGRDYYDLLWYLKKGVQPNIKRLSNLLGEPQTVKDIEKKLDKKVNKLMSKYRTDFEDDLRPFIRNTKLIKEYVDHYREEYLIYKAGSFSPNLTLALICRRCGKKFLSGIMISKDSLETVVLKNNIHRCPFCGFDNLVSKKDYISIDKI